VVDVVGEPHGDTARRRVDERFANRVADRAGEADVVERKLEPLARGAEKCDQRLADLFGRLAAVRQRAELDQLRCAFSEAL
jgi:hypothetical protein